MRNEPIKLRGSITLVKKLEKKKKSKLWSCAWKSDSLSLFTRTFTSSKLVSNYLNSRGKGRIGVGSGKRSHCLASGSDGMVYPKILLSFLESRFLH